MFRTVARVEGPLMLGGATRTESTSGHLSPKARAVFSKWRTDDYWRYALFAAVAVIRACAARLGISVHEFAERLARLHGVELP